MSNYAERNERAEEAIQTGKDGSKYVRASCPFCEDEGHADRKLSLSYSKSTGWWQCFRCNTKGKLGDHEDREFEEQPVDDEAVDLPSEFVRLYRNRSSVLKPARDYLRSRNVPEYMWKKLDLRAACEGWWNGRIIIPHYSVDGVTCLGWISRIWTPKPHRNAIGLAAQKYLYMPGMDRGKYVFNQAALLEETDEPVIIVEGAFDTFPFWPHASALLGDCSGFQYESLKCAFRPVCVVLDGDAWQKGQMLAWKLRFDGQRAGHVKMEAGVDPDEVDPEWLRQRALESINEPM